MEIIPKLGIDYGETENEAKVIYCNECASGMQPLLHAALVSDLPKLDLLICCRIIQAGGMQSSHIQSEGT